jgi:hypothetical protein
VAHRSGIEPLSVWDMSVIIDGCDHDRDFWRYLSHLRKAGRFGASADAVRFLSDLAATVENSRGRAVNSAPGASATFRRWIDTSRRNAAFIHKMSDESIDEISRVVIESKHAARQ